MDGTLIDTTLPIADDGRSGHGFCLLVPQSTTSFLDSQPLPDPLIQGWEQHVDSNAAFRPASPSPSSICDYFPPLPADAIAHYQAAASSSPIPRLRHARLTPPSHPDHPRHRPPPGPAGPACLVDADWELARALAADPFHLDWPHW